MRIYLAAQFKDIKQMREYAKQLRTLGDEVTSRWLRERGEPEMDLDPDKDYRKNAKIDLEDIDAADTFVLFTVPADQWIKRGGKHFEAGYAYATSKNCVVIGPKENIFYYLEGWHKFESWDEFWEVYGGTD